MWVALKPMTVGEQPLVEDGEVVTDPDSGQPVMVPLVRQAGEHVPEADSWPNVAAYVNTGQLAFVGDGDVQDVGMRAEIDQLKAEIKSLGKDVAALKKTAHTHNQSTTKEK